MARILTKPFRMGYPNLIEKNKFGSYGIKMMFKKCCNISALKNMAKDAVEEEWGGKKSLKNVKHPFSDGDKSGDPNTAGYVIVSLNSKSPITVIDVNKEEVTEQGRLIGGHWARAVITSAFAWHKQGGGISFNCESVQILPIEAVYSLCEKCETDCELDDSPFGFTKRPVVEVVSEYDFIAFESDKSGGTDFEVLDGENDTAKGVGAHVEDDITF